MEADRNMDYSPSAPFSYERFPNTLFKIIGEEGETYYYQMKFLFFAYLFISIVEFFLQRRVIASTHSYITSRMLIATTYPWLTVTVFFLTQALTGDMLEMPWEILWANFATLLGIYLAIRLEWVFDVVEFRPSLR